VFQAVAQLVASAFQSLVVLKGATISKPGLRNLNTRIILQILGRSKYYLLSSMVVFLYAKADQILLSAFHGLAKLAPYSIAVMVIESSMVIFPVLASIFSSRISDQSSTASSNSLRSLNQLLCLTAIIFLGAVIAFALIGIPFFFGNKYVGLNINIVTLSPCIIITAMTTSLILQMQHERMSKIILIANSVTAVASLLMSIPLIYYASGIGASLATSLSSAMLPITLLVLGGSKTKYNMHRLAV
jgi:O-antigen/teichoic acid export membrane protein